MPLAFCPECAAEVHVDEEVDKGDIIKCEECETSLQVVGMDPIELDITSEGESEDYYSNDDDEY